MSEANDEATEAKRSSALANPDFVRHCEAERRSNPEKKKRLNNNNTGLLR
jgi:hypothetical protein